ncbi:hypothetical protein ACFSJS_27425 [Streptomyces desertarenae]|uniref:Uncharacterized protein n=1 Tax=Streptomyces desertarenae TaxID=2666184 RepID=A0ABW4PRH4_9ACTN
MVPFQVKPTPALLTGTSRIVPCRHFGRESLSPGQNRQAGDVLLGSETLRDRHQPLRGTTVQKQLVHGFRKLLSQSGTKTVRRSGDQNRGHGAPFLCRRAARRPGGRRAR